MTKSWRDLARAVILKAIDEARTQGLSIEETRKLVDTLYPFGERAHHPYKMWLSERRKLLSGDPQRNMSDQAKLQAWNEGKPL